MTTDLGLMTYGELIDAEREFFRSMTPDGRPKKWSESDRARYARITRMIEFRERERKARNVR
jgi:hypothetical protein